MRLRKKPVEIEGWRWLYAHPELGKQERIPRWLEEGREDWPEVGGVKFELGHPDGPRVIINTGVDGVSEGLMTVLPGDWILRGVKGEIYPCKDEVLRLTYDLLGLL